MMISVVVPLYACSKSIHELNDRLIITLKKIVGNYEIIYVNDASPENDWQIIVDLAKGNRRVKGINFSRNFGQHLAITAGLKESKGDLIVVMDGDLQDSPEEIPRLYKKFLEGFDIVLARRIRRQDGKRKKLFSLLFYKLFGYLTNTDYDNSVANFGLYHRKVINAILEMKDRVRVFPILVQWVGFSKTSVDVQHNERTKGKTSYSYKKLFSLAFDMIISFSNKILNLTIRLGILISFLSLVVGAFYLYRYSVGKIEISGYASLIVSIWFLSGVIIFSIGVLGIYIGRIFDATKGRPDYLIREKINT